MSSFLIVKDAVKYCGKSESTLKRLIREIIADPNHEDRSLIDPGHDDLEAKKEAGEPYVWKIHTDLLDKRYGADESASASPASKPKAETDSANETIVSLLREQLETKDRQIETLEKQLDRKDDQISSQNERMREQNILMKDLQQRLSIAAPGQQADVVNSQPVKEGSDSTKKDAEKSSIWTREFRLFRRRQS
ncbi:hypothetical protein LOC71_05180 [Rhodopirellula sp. JC740]|uniref:Chromosome partition protein Smc n=1 Tax=Rhodopirellula halodulae TaxID=2894198 RepID=A0ABS8NDP4_9BACT|nr:hypothetical protein [Rhodopirellula sp. JC740]MCC9641658.1 hypothetical protein [Rhodopirellula sp. JC740]